MDYKERWIELKKWVEKEEKDMLKNPDRCTVYYSGISCQTQYIKGKMEELERK